jgi:hypothetical protein
VGSDKEDSDVEGYERLRARALSGDAAGWRLGMAVLQHRGMAAWLRVSRGAAAPARPRPQPPCAPQPIAAGAADELVGVLACMALGALARG